MEYDYLLLNFKQTTLRMMLDDAIYQTAISVENLLDPDGIKGLQRANGTGATSQQQGVYFIRKNFEGKLGQLLESTINSSKSFEDSLMHKDQNYVFGSLIGLLVNATLAVIIWALTMRAVYPLVNKPFTCLTTLKQSELNDLIDSCSLFCLTSSIHKGPKSYSSLNLIGNNEYNSNKEVGTMQNDVSYNYQINPSMQALPQFTPMPKMRNNTSLAGFKRENTSLKPQQFPYKKATSKRIMDRSQIDEMDSEDFKNDRLGFGQLNGQQNVYVLPMSDSQSDSIKNQKQPANPAKTISYPPFGRESAKYYETNETEAIDLMPTINYKRVTTRDSESDNQNLAFRIRQMQNYTGSFWKAYIKTCLVALLFFFPWLIASFNLDINTFRDYYMVVGHLQNLINLNLEVARMSDLFLQVADTGKTLTRIDNQKTINLMSYSEGRLLTYLRKIDQQDLSLFNSKFSSYTELFREVVDNPLCLSTQLFNYRNNSKILKRIPTENCRNMTRFGLIASITKFVELEKELTARILSAQDPKAEGRQTLQDSSSIYRLDTLSYTIQNSLVYLSRKLQSVISIEVSNSILWYYLLCYGGGLANWTYFLVLHRRYLNNMQQDVYLTRSIVSIIPLDTILKNNDLTAAINKK